MKREPGSVISNKDTYLTIGFKRRGLQGWRPHSPQIPLRNSMETWEAQARRKWGKGKREAREQEVKREKGVDEEQRERQATKGREAEEEGSKGRREEKTEGKRAGVAVGGGGCLGKAVRAIAVWG
jgi:hypothetical protein